MNPLDILTAESRGWAYAGFAKPSWDKAPPWANWLALSRTTQWTWTKTEPACSMCFFLETKEKRP